MINNLIFDLGAFEGQDSEFYLRKGFDVVAVEANPAMHPAIRARNASYLNDNRLKLVEGAIADATGKVALHINKYAQWSSVYPARSGIVKEVRVEAINPTDLFHSFGIPYYVKIDIEGADTLVLRAISDLGESRPQYVSFEVSPSWRADISMLLGAGYSRFKLVEQHGVPSMSEPIPPREGIYAGYKFTHANSGLFGAELPGEWMDQTQILVAIKKINWELVLPSGWKNWYDIHATR